MKVTYDKLSKSIKVDGKIRKKPSEKILSILILDQIRKGESLSDLEYFDVPNAIPFYKAMAYVHESCAEEYISAERDRARVLQERMIQAANNYRKKPTPENKNKFEAALKAHESTDKKKPDAPVSLEFHSLVPDLTWELKAFVIKKFGKDVLDEFEQSYNKASNDNGA